MMGNHGGGCITVIVCHERRANARFPRGRRSLDAHHPTLEPADADLPPAAELLVEVGVAGVDPQDAGVVELLPGGDDGRPRDGAGIAPLVASRFQGGIETVAEATPPEAYPPER